MTSMAKIQDWSPDSRTLETSLFLRQYPLMVKSCGSGARLPGFEFLNFNCFNY